MRTVSRLSALLIACCLLLSFALVHAQDATATPADASQTGATTAKVSCDSDLILNLYLAERYFGFAAVHNGMMTSATDTTGMVDLNNVDYGQYTPWFTSLSGMMGSSMMMPGQTMTDQQMSDMNNMMTMSDADMANQMATTVPAGTDMSTMTALNAGTMAGEATDCASLRKELSRFFNVVAAQDVMAGMTGSTSGTGTSTSGEATPEETPAGG